ncbi:MAG: glycerate kinase [Erysipelotrichaceae bacterium]|nr:glycerate kinase [Erysipelotrichaceae bacterium]
MTLRSDAKKIINSSIRAVKPDSAVKNALNGRKFNEGDIYLVAIGKAAWQMAHEAVKHVKNIKDGIVITKYGHIMGDIRNVRCYEAGHPVVDRNSFLATSQALKMTENLKENDTVIFLVSGGGSALFEESRISLEKLQDVNRQLLNCGASINEINVIRKRLSKVKGGRFARHCLPASVFQIVLSDVIGDDLSTIASGPAYGDTSDYREVENIINKYSLTLDEEILEILKDDPPRPNEINNVETLITGSVSQLCLAAEGKAWELGYETLILTDTLQIEARKAGKQLAEKAVESLKAGKKTCLIMGGETTVKITGKGLGGRNQELALSAAEFIRDENILIFSIGSDGTDGPTDAAGGIVDGKTFLRLQKKGISIPEVLQNNDSYNALRKVNGLIFTGPTGTNVNDVAVALIDPE